VHLTNWQASFKKGFEEKVSGEEVRPAKGRFRRTRTTIGILVAIVAVLLLAAGGLVAGRNLTGFDLTNPASTTTPTPTDSSTAP
jgi:hypothetical protein